ncbi:ComF family protein [Campylobacter sp. FMV-PI01]|uniref:ComF family protein n=1 Tax=Campylobacter portucalensis TaxID=2608384 RepID=A0A6L5WFM4_9BACT|nr:ComF family protein [Campylobacter portucalensis]MSN95784.1 ComF family protein [Campylobacter portucalensis]
MRCLNCGKLNFSFICKDCIRNLSEFTPNKRMAGKLNVYSFYKYSEIKHLIHTKHSLSGVFVYKILANLSFKNFAKTLNLYEKVYAIGVDNDVTSGYSHTAILANSLKTSEIYPLFNSLKMNSKIKYSGKTLNFRQKHKREFKILKAIDRPVILVDDIITTGETLKQAHEILDKSDIRVLFGLVLADARE